jgi:ATP-dependent Lon protease
MAFIGRNADPRICDIGYCFYNTWPNIIGKFDCSFNANFVTSAYVYELLKDIHTNRDGYRHHVHGAARKLNDFKAALHKSGVWPASNFDGTRLPLNLVMKNKDQNILDPAGFTRLTLYSFDHMEQEVTEVELLLPSTAEIRKHSIETRAEASSMRSAYLSEQRRIEECRIDSLSTKPERSKQPAASRTGQVDLEAARTELKLRQEADLAAPGDNQDSAEVYAWDLPLKLLETTKTPDKDAHVRNKGIFDLLKEAGNRRKLAGPDADSIESGLQQLRLECPNFSEVVAFIANQFSLSRMQGKPVRLPPLLLSGPPGVGKTYFCDKLAIFIGTKLVRIAFDCAQTSSVLMGSSKNWGNTTFGLVFESVCLSSVANPLLFLDEIDKVSEGPGYQNPLASLHSLLEPVSSKRVKDISLDFQFDASLVMWIAACNESTAISSSLRSRFIEFQIDTPYGADALELAKAMVQKTHLQVAPSGFAQPGYDIARLVAHLTPREQRQALERAYASAVAVGRNHLVKQDLPGDVLEGDSPSDDEQTAWLH